MSSRYELLEEKLASDHAVYMSNKEMRELMQHRIEHCYNNWKWEDVMIFGLMLHNDDIHLPGLAEMAKLKMEHQNEH